MVRLASLRPRAALVIVSMIFCTCFRGQAVAGGQESPSAPSSRVLIPNRYIVVLDDDADAQANARAAAQSYGVGLFHVYEYAFKGFTFRGSAEVARAIEHSPQVEFVAQDQV